MNQPQTARQQLAEFLDKINVYIKKPMGNQPDAFLLGIMKPPEGKYPVQKDVLELTEDMIISDDFLPEAR
jgi:hypothetical protein